MKTFRIVLSLISLIAMILGFIYIWHHYSDTIIKLTTDKHYLEGFIEQYPVYAPLIFISVQALQIIIFVLPGEVTQIAGGYLFGIWAGSLYSTIGAFLGTAIAFLLARLTGEVFIEMIISREKLDKWSYYLNHHQGLIPLFILFLTPGIPKDILSYIAGLTPIRFSTFVILTTIARIPGIILSSYYGSLIAQKSYTILIIAIIIVAIIMISAYIYREELKSIKEKILHKYFHEHRTHTPPQDNAKGSNTHTK